MPPKMKVDFFHFLEEVDPFQETEASAKIGSWPLTIDGSEIRILDSLGFSEIF